MSKIEQLRKRMKENQVEAMLVSSQANVYYLSNFYAEAGVAVILVTQEHATIISDGRFMTEAKEATKGFDVVRWKTSMFTDLGEYIDELKIKEISIDQDDITYGQQQELEQHTKAKIVFAPKLLEGMRKIKSEEELILIRKACEIADESFSEILSFIRPGVSEKEVTDELEFQMRKRGASTCSFETIVASGERGALPHGVASERILQKGDMITMDFGALYKHYCSDITRTVALGDVNEELLRIYEIVKQTQAFAASILKAGIASKDLDLQIRAFMKDKGYDLIHGPGHSFGLEIHEAPFISYTSDAVFEENVVVTLEPGIYVPGLGGVRIEDDFLVKKDGCEQITKSKKELIILPT
ncbi:M24 family metallopeptidase [Amedibacillus sp. YH-ame10]